MAHQALSREGRKSLLSFVVEEERVARKIEGEKS